MVHLAFALIALRIARRRISQLSGRDSCSLSAAIVSAVFPAPSHANTMHKQKGHRTNTHSMNDSKLSVMYSNSYEQFYQHLPIFFKQKKNKKKQKRLSNHHYCEYLVAYSYISSNEKKRKNQLLSVNVLITPTCIDN